MRYLLIILFLFSACLAEGQALFHAHNRASAPPAPACAAEGVNVAAVVNSYKTRLATAGHTMTTTEETAVTAYVQGLVDSCIFYRVKEEWPFIGGTAATHALSLRGGFDLTFFNSPTHSSTGTDWNGSSQYASTGLNPSLVLQDSTLHISYYSQDNTNGGSGDALDFGALNGPELLITAANTATFGGSAGMSINGRATATPASKAGFFLGFLTPDNSARKLYHNGVELVSGAGSTLSHVNAPLYMGAAWLGSAYGHTDRKVSFASVGYGLTASQAAYFSQLVNNLQTALSRNVY